MNENLRLKKLVRKLYKECEYMCTGICNECGSFRSNNLGLRQCQYKQAQWTMEEFGIDWGING